MKVWISLIVIYLSFFIWYTDLGGKLTDDEIEYYANKFEQVTKEHLFLLGVL